jgi:integrase
LRSWFPYACTIRLECGNRYRRGMAKSISRSCSRKSLTPEEILRILKIASESKRNLAMILLAYRHGVRPSEVCDLRLSDVDMKNGEVA